MAVEPAPATATPAVPPPASAAAPAMTSAPIWPDAVAVNRSAPVVWMLELCTYAWTAAGVPLEPIWLEATDRPMATPPPALPPPPTEAATAAIVAVMAALSVAWSATEPAWVMALEAMYALTEVETRLSATAPAPATETP